MATAPLSCICPFENRSSSLEKDSKMVNCYVEKDDDKTYYAVKRTGVIGELNLGDGAAQMLAAYNGHMCVIQGNFFFYKAQAVDMFDIGMCDFVAPDSSPAILPI